MKLLWKDSITHRSITLLSKSELQRILLVILIQVIIGVLDLLGVIAIGLVSSLAVRGIQSQSAGTRVTQALTSLHIEKYSFQTQVCILGIGACFVLIIRTILSAYLTKRTLFFLSRRSASITTRLINKLLCLDLLQIQKRTSQHTLFALTSGVQAITVGIIGSAVSLASDISVLIILVIGLFTVDLGLATFTFILLSIVSIVLYFQINKKVQVLGTVQSNLTIASNEKILEVLNSYREAVVRNRRRYYAQVIGDIRLSLSNTSAELSFIPNIAKYVLEVTLVVVALSMSAFQFTTKNASLAIGTLAIFFAATSRIAPAILRVQSGLVAIKSNIGIAKTSLDMIEELFQIKDLPQENNTISFEHSGFRPKIKFSNVSFSYPGSTHFAVRNINIEITEGSFVVLVGASGSGKTTLVDLMLGILKPHSGDITISGISASEVLNMWPGAMAYVPQDIMIIEGSIADNITLGFPENLFDKNKIYATLEKAQLDDYVNLNTRGLDAYVGERGTNLSGGQRQRLGIARAMFTLPKLLVLDEATSALDPITEQKIYNSLESLKGNTTIIMIAHRLASIKKADSIIYLENGRISAQGTYEEMLRENDSFRKQVKTFEGSNDG